MPIRWRRRALALAAVAGLGCNGDNGPAVSAPIIAKAGTKSGDTQTGPAGQPLPNELRVVVTRVGALASGATVTWSTGSGGSLTPTSDLTDAEGISWSVWTLGGTSGPQSGDARVVGGVLNSITSFIATATSGTPVSIVQVISQDQNGDHRFVP